MGRRSGTLAKAKLLLGEANRRLGDDRLRPTPPTIKNRFCQSATAQDSKVQLHLGKVQLHLVEARLHPYP